MPAVSNPPAPVARLRPLERELSDIWRDQSFTRRGLTTAGGLPLRVVYRGRPGPGAGPDFRDAVLVLGGVPVQGDIELHVRASDFRRHGHHLDPAYGDVALHVVFIGDDGGETPLPGGGRAPVLVLGREANGRRAPFGEPCRDAVARSGAGAVTKTLDRLGLMRFRQKSAAWSKRLAAGEEPEQALWSGLLEALGYGGAREEMRCVAEAAPWQAVANAVRAGGAKAAAWVLRSTWLAAQPNALWQAGLRPGNRPERRIEGAAALVARFLERGGVAAALLAPLDEDESPETTIAALTVPRLVGRARAAEITANAVLPLAAALCGESAARRYEAQFARLPLTARYGAVRHLHEAAGEAVRVNTQRQQGMLYLLRQYCSQGGCGKCPLS